MGKSNGKGKPGFLIRSAHRFCYNLPNILHHCHILIPHRTDTYSVSISHLTHQQLTMLASILLYMSISVGLVAASPVQRREMSQNDITGLQLADHLENLELSLYSSGCQNIDNDAWSAASFPSTFQQDICTIAEVSVGCSVDFCTPLTGHNSNSRIKRIISPRSFNLTEFRYLSLAHTISPTTLQAVLWPLRTRSLPSASVLIWEA